MITIIMITIMNKLIVNNTIIVCQAQPAPSATRPAGSFVRIRRRPCAMRTWSSEGLTEHYEYVALAKKTFILREATPLLLEPRCFGVDNSKVVPISVDHICPQPSVASNRHRSAPSGLQCALIAYIYIYIERERERDRYRENGKGGMRKGGIGNFKKT